jgi:hypothetical protein
VIVVVKIATEKNKLNLNQTQICVAVNLSNQIGSENKDRWLEKFDA